MNRREFCQSALVSASVLSTWSARAQTVTQARTAVVAVVPLGSFPSALLAEIEAGLRAELGATVVAQGPYALPGSAFYAPRRRYRADRLLDFLRPRVAAPANRALGVTEVDISATAHGVYDWGVLGLGDIAGTACVISTYRCRRNAPSEAQVHFRMVTTCIHEVGHTLGLEHCPDPRCLMTAARGSVLTVDRTTGHLCASCRRRLGLAPLQSSR